MAIDFAELVQGKVSRDAFIREQEAKAPRRKPKRIGKKPTRGTLWAIRNKRLTIREAALRRAQMIIRYKKITTGEFKTYVVAPYEWKYRRLKIGLRKVLYAYDMVDRHIKSFVQSNIRNVTISDRKFAPKWPVKIA